MEEQILLFKYGGKVPFSYTKEEIVSVDPEYFVDHPFLSKPPEPMEQLLHQQWLIDNHFLPREIGMGKHSLFFVNQVHGLAVSDHVIVTNLQTIGKDECYQFDANGPDWIRFPQKQWNLDRWVDPPFTSPFLPQPQFLEDDDSPLVLEEFAITKNSCHNCASYASHHCLFKPAKHLCYDNAVQEIVYVWYNKKIGFL